MVRSSFRTRPRAPSCVHRCKFSAGAAQGGKECFIQSRPQCPSPGARPPQPCRMADKHGCERPVHHPSKPGQHDARHLRGLPPTRHRLPEGVADRNGSPVFLCGMPEDSNLILSIIPHTKPRSPQTRHYQASASFRCLASPCATNTLHQQ